MLQEMYFDYCYRKNDFSQRFPPSGRTCIEFYQIYMISFDSFNNHIWYITRFNDQRTHTLCSTCFTLCYQWLNCILCLNLLENSHRSLTHHELPGVEGGEAPAAAFRLFAFLWNVFGRIFWTLLCSNISVYKTKVYEIVASMSSTANQKCLFLVLHS